MDSQTAHLTTAGSLRGEPERGMTPIFDAGRCTGFCSEAASFCWQAQSPSISGRIADFVETVEKSCVPTVRAMKEYQHDTGQLPDSMDDLVPKYLASRPNGQDISKGHFMQIVSRGAVHFITYDFNPGSEAWEISGPWFSGVIPVPPVTIAPATTRAAK